MPGGRPTKFKKEFIELGAEIAALGATDAQLAKILKVSIDTISEWKNRYPEFSASLKNSKNDLDAKVEQSLYRRARGYTRTIERLSKEGDPIECKERLPPDTTACIFWLKNRQPAKWRDKQDIEHSGGPLVAVIKTGDD